MIELSFLEPGLMPRVGLAIAFSFFEPGLLPRSVTSDLKPQPISAEFSTDTPSTFAVKEDVSRDIFRISLERETATLNTSVSSE
ncbi:hypothetical protein AVEN_61873-1 [Araneus ventricosus]|uniref:Uncharacterized protein n=1 Tax=Araneus ventricosus TaxID=182803 RepID=A0A4Y2FW91_ARAVE|nr:hypothetical protein AVEN_61873-1 [Araneus ventricosus]